MDSIANMLTIIRNAQIVKHDSVIVPFSNLKNNIAIILEKEKFINKAEVIKIKKGKYIKIFLKYDNGDQNPAISEIKKISKPGQRVYASYKEIKPHKNGYGIKIISTPKGLLTDKEVRRQKIGGEIICSVF